MALNLIALICWTAIAPLVFNRTTKDGTDPWNRAIGSYGHCGSEDPGASVPYLVVIRIISMSALVIASCQSYRARKIRTEFNESFYYIAMANASFCKCPLFVSPSFSSREKVLVLTSSFCALPYFYSLQQSCFAYLHQKFYP